MKAVFLESKKKLEFKDIPLPKCSENDVCVKLAEVGLCGSDVHWSNHGRIGDYIMEKPFILGYEGSGIVSEIGKKVSSFTMTPIFCINCLIM